MHAVLDQLEEPGIVMRQAIREMEEELARQQQREKWLGKEIDTASARIEGFAALARDLEVKLDVSFANGNEALARRLVRRKLETARLAEHAETHREALQKQLGELGELIASNRDQLDGMRQKAEILAMDDSAGPGPSETGTAGVDEDDVEIAFLREKQTRATS
jgi:phage shock protein A